MSAIRSTPGTHRLALVVLLAAAMLFGIVSTADAGSITYWSSIQPQGTVGADIPVIIKGKGGFDAYPLVRTSGNLYIDGEQMPAGSYYASILRTSVYFRYVPSPVLTDGLHTFRAEVSDTSGLVSFHEWTATVRQPPSASWVAPAAGSALANGRPTITLYLADNTPGTEFALTGQVRTGSAAGPVVATFGGSGLGAGLNSFKPSAELPAATYYLTATVTDGAANSVTLQGAAARSFVVEASAPMTILTSCDDCHSIYQSAHPTPVTTDCTVCHPGKDGDHMEGTEYCEDCHWDGWHTGGLGAFVAVSSPCTDCHSSARPAIVRHTSASTTDVHVSTSTGCEPCHSADLPTQHAVTPVGSSFAYQCDLCHGPSASQQVKDAIASGDTACSGCHDGPSTGHESLHTLERTDECVDCHEGASLTAVHLDAGLACTTCHDSEDEDVIAAIDGGLRECSACHTAVGVDYHLNMAVHYAPDSYETCGHCHHGWGSNPTRGPDVTRHASCTTCHNDTMDLTGLTTKCINCHDTEGVDYHLQTAVRHTPVDSGSLDCARCHGTTDVRELHAAPGCETCHATYNCSECHSMHNGNPGTALLTGISCEARCHTQQGVDYHSGFDTAHTFSAMDAGCQATGCHVAALTDAHEAFVGAGNRYPQYSDTCALCHLNDDPDRIPVDATADCSSCHEVHGDLDEQHTPATFSGYADLVGAADPENPGLYCQECHGTPEEIASWVHDYGAGAGTNVDCRLCHDSSNLMTLHSADCSLCHSQGGPRQSFTTWNESCQQGDCHPTLHPNARAGHDLVACVDCHDHEVLTFDRCGTCHDINDLIPPVTTSTAKAVYQGSATIGLNSTDWPSVGSSGVARTYYAVDGGSPVQGTLVSVAAPPSGTQQTHVLEFWSVDIAGNVETRKTASFRCINMVDTVAPTGTVAVNGGAPYTPTRYVTLNSNVTDAGTGVWQMRVDPGTGTFGEWIDYSATYQLYVPNTTGTKTVRAQFKDYLGNTVQLSDTILLDITAPLVGSNVLSNYTGSATINLSPSDVGSGVAHTYYVLDGGAQVEGTVVNVAGPPSGSTPHTLEYWAVDNVGRVSVHQFAQFVILAPGASVGTVELRTVWPGDIDWCSWEVRNAGGALIAFGEQAGPVSNPIVATVPVSAQAYTVTISYIWYGEPVRDETFSALVDSSGKTVTFWYN